MLLNRYTDINFVMNLSFFDGINLINKAQEKIIEKQDWQLYCGIYPNMDKSNFISFEKFRSKKQIIRVENKLSDDEILKKAEEVKKIHQGKREGMVKY